MGSLASIGLYSTLGREEEGKKERTVSNDKSDNEVKTGTVHRSPGIGEREYNYQVKFSFQSMERRILKASW